ncbi:MAG: hypothetical protein J6Y59_00035 [Bacteroidaceae bacterium]|nr:hypothetical protein [Bacteroidaceae bacterium]
MKTEDIDKRIGMPDVDKEWARFEQEVIGKETKRRPVLAWAMGIGIAASVALLLIFNIGKIQKEEPLVAQVQPAQPEHVSEPARVPAKEVVAEVSKPVATPRKELTIAKADASATTGLDIPAREYTGAVQKIKMDDMGDLAFESVDQALQGQIAGQDISHNEAEPELQGVIAGHEGIDPTYNDSILVLLDGKRLPDSLCTRQFARRGIHKYLEKKGLLVDKIVRLNEESVRIKGDEQTKQRYKQYVEQYGRLAQLGVAEITSANDSANEVFVLQHPELKKTFRRVEGFVMEESTNEPLESTIIRHRQFATSADPLGHFVLWVPKSVDTLYAKCIGCQDAFFQPADTTLTIRLKDNYRTHDIASADLSSGTTMRLRGIGDSKPDSFLVVVNGKTLFDSRGMTSEEIDRRIEEYLNEQGLLQNIKIPWDNGAIAIWASTPEERKEIERMIANLTIVPKLPHLGSGTLRLIGTGSGPSDKDRIDSTLILVNGEPLPNSLKWQVLGESIDDVDTYMPRYFSRQGLLIDSVYVHKDSEFTERYGGLAKYGVIEIKTVPDTYCDAYVRKHPKLMKKYTRVEGYIVNNEGKPLTEAWVHLKEESLTGAATDSTGHFVFWVPRKDVTLRAEQSGYKSFEFSPTDKSLVMHLEKSEKGYNMRLRGNPEPTPELQGQIAGLPPIDICRVKNDYHRTINKQAPDTTLTLVNGKEDEAFNQYRHEIPYWSEAFVYDYFFQRNQLFLRQKASIGDEAKSYAHLFNGRDIRWVMDYLTIPYTPVSQFTPEELKARRLAYLLRCYREGKNNQDYHGMPSPDLFDTPQKERLFGLLGVKYHSRISEKFGHVSCDSRGTYIPLERNSQFTVQDEIWEENGEWLGMEDDERFNAARDELEKAAAEASSSLIERDDSIVGMAFIYGGKVTKGAPHESPVMWVLKDKVKESTFEFTPDEDAPSYWTAEVYYSTYFPRQMEVHLRSVDKLYASECPDILNIHYKRLTGVVQDEEGKPVSGALVSYRDRPYFSQSDATDSLGRFELMLPNMSDTISVIRIGYEKQTIRVLPTDSVLTIRLKENDWKELRESLKKKQ